MNHEEQATFGSVVARLTAVLRDAAAGERVYIFAFGEELEHWHVLLAPRAGDVPQEYRRADYYLNWKNFENAERAKTVAADIKAAFASPR
jgi:hypothetical protein